MKLNYMVTGAVLMALAVMAGAFGAHGLKEKISPEQIVIWEKAVFYQVVHALALIITGMLWLSKGNKKMRMAGIFFLFGILFFSGSLYLLSLKEISFTANFTSVLGPITPIGGLCFIVGWVWMAWGAAQIKE